MAVHVFSNNLPQPTIRAALQEAVLAAMGTPSGDWRVQVHETAESPSWHITIWGPNHFHWTREFFGLEEQNSFDGYAFIRKTISDVLWPIVFLSYAYPDNTDGFVNQLSQRLAQELQLQTGEPLKVVWVKDDTISAEKLIGSATFLIPVVSPSYFKSAQCRVEFELFAEREQRTNHSLVLPAYFVTAGELENVDAQPQDAWAQQIKRHNIVDLRQHRFDLTSAQALQVIATLARLVRNEHAKLLRGEASNLSNRPKPAIEPRDSFYIQSLRLTDFRCFEQIELHFDRPSSLDGRWTCIAGINGAGKSTILQALSLALLGNPLVLELGGERLNRMRRHADLFNQKRATIEVSLKAEKSSELVQLKLAIDAGRLVSIEGPSFAPSLPASWDRIRQHVIAGYGATRNLSPRIDSGNEHLSPDVRHQITLFDPLSQLAGGEVLLGRTSPTWPFLDLFQSLIQQVFDTELEIVLGSPITGIGFTVSKKDNVDAIDLPDGFRSAVAWLADLCSIWADKAPNLAANANPSDIQAIVLIDEIDLHLHPSLQRALVPRLRKALPKVQWIVTTHSPLVLANFDVSEIIALDRDREGNVRELDRQILGFSSDEIYEWLMGTRPMGAAIEDELRKSDDGLGKDPTEIATLMRISPDTSKETAEKQVAEFKEILKALKR